LLAEPCAPGVGFAGFSGAPGAGGYKGKIDEVAVFDRVLTASEIHELFLFY